MPIGRVIVRISMPLAAIAACAPSPQETAMHSASPNAVNTGQDSNAQQAAVGPAAEPVSAAANPAPMTPADSPAEAQGRRILSTAFVQVGPDGHLTVELHGGRVLVLRDVVMRPKDYCGVQVVGGPAGTRYCGGYADVTAARPGGAPAAVEPDLAAPNPLKSPGGTASRN